MPTPTTLGIIFLVLGGLVTLSELHTLTIYLLALAIGLFAAGATTLLGGSTTLAFTVLAIVLILGLPLAHWWRGKLKNREADEASRDDQGQTVSIVQVNETGLRVAYRGSTWDARLDAAVEARPAVGDTFRIARREGNLLILGA